MRARALLALIAALLVAGCASGPLGGMRVSATMLDPEPMPSEPAADVQIFRSQEAVQEKYIEVAMLSVSVDSRFAGDDKLIAALQRKAGELGASALIITEFKSPTFAESLLLGSFAQRSIRAVAIRWQN